MLDRLRTLLPYVAILGLLGGVYALPPDTSLREVRAAGALSACVPTRYPPLVTGDPAAPGIDIELLAALAKGMGVRLIVAPNAAMGQDFNPRNWHVTRAQCQILGGGVVASPTTRSFLETSPSYAETGWALVGPRTSIDLRDRPVGVWTGISGLDRLALSRYLRAQNARLIVVQSPSELVAGIRDGRFDVGVTERLLAEQLAGAQGWHIAWMPGDLPRFPLALGLWKGDLTLKRAVVDGLERLTRDGELARILDRYLGAGRAPHA